jgi:hypothetical protein
MKLVPISAFVLLLASVATLISGGQSGRLIEESWASAANVLPDAKLTELQRTTLAYASRILGLFPEQIRQKFAAKTWQPVTLMTLRSLVLWHLVPVFLVLLMVGFLEGSWARANQNTLVKVHSPMRFSLALGTLGLSLVLAPLWITAPIALSARLLVFVLGALLITSTRNLIVHAPTQF